MPATLAASAGALLGKAYQFDMIRPGIGLYGGHPLGTGESPFRATLRLSAPILQVRFVDKPETVGYGATHEVEGPRLIATVAIGYADGVMRSLSNRGAAAIGPHLAPIVGRVSMDLVSLDVTGLPGIRAGQMAEFIGPLRPVDAVAREAGTLAYEIMTRLGPRLRRVYLGAAGDA